MTLALDGVASGRTLGRSSVSPSRSFPSVDVQLLQEGKRVVDRLEQVLVVLDHLAAHVDAKPLLVDVGLISVEYVPS